MEFFNAFRVDVPTLLFQIINFLLLLWLLNRFLFRSVVRMLDERGKRISKGLEDAEAAARDRELARAEREAALDAARKEAQAIIARATKIADDSKAEILAEAKAQAEKTTARARDEITADYAYFRLRDEGYTPDDIARWADVIREKTSGCSDVFVYFKHEESGKGPEFGKMLMEHLRV